MIPVLETTSPRFFLSLWGGLLMHSSPLLSFLRSSDTVSTPNGSHTFFRVPDTRSNPRSPIRGTVCFFSIRLRFRSLAGDGIAFQASPSSGTGKRSGDSEKLPCMLHIMPLTLNSKSGHGTCVSHSFFRFFETFHQCSE